VASLPVGERGDSSMREVFSPTPNAPKVAALLAREAELRKGARRIVGLRRRDRAVIETELAVIHRLLEQLGYQRGAPTAASQSRTPSSAT
jgi:hypothetical protein